MTLSIPPFPIVDALHPNWLPTHAHRGCPQPVWRPDGRVTLATMATLWQIVRTVQPDYTLLVWCLEHPQGLCAQLVQGFCPEGEP